METVLFLQVKLNFDNHNIKLSSVAVSATIPWQEGKEEDFAELREGLRWHIFRSTQTNPTFVPIFQEAERGRGLGL